MQYLRIFSLFVLALGVNEAWASHYEPLCKICPSPTYPLCLADVSGFTSDQWQLIKTKGQCGPSGGYTECCLCTNYQEFTLIKEGAAFPSFEGDSAIVCCLCLFSKFYAERAGQIKIYVESELKGQDNNKHIEKEYGYEQCQLLFCLGHTDAHLENKQSSACHILGNGVVCISGDTKDCDCLCCFNRCNPDEEPTAPIACQMTF